jgi:hypothetical protein
MPRGMLKVIEVMQSTHILRLHATNVAGIGAIQLVSNLAPALENSNNSFVKEIFIGENDLLDYYKPTISKSCIKLYARRLPNAISRFLECTLFASFFSGSGTLIVLGDIPLRICGNQIVLVHTPHLCNPNIQLIKERNYNALISSLLFKFNKNFVDNFVVQTYEMQEKLSRKYSIDKAKINIIKQPVPKWLLDQKR